MSSLLLLLIVVVAAISFSKITSTSNGGVPLSRRRIPPLVRILCGVVGVALYASVLTTSLLDLARSTAPVEAEHDKEPVMVESPVRSLGERYPVGIRDVQTISNANLLVTMIAFNQYNDVTGVQAKEVHWSGETVTIPWKRQISAEIKSRVDLTLSKLTVRQTNGKVMLEVNGERQVQEWRRNGRASSSGAFGGADAEAPTLFRLSNYEHRGIRSGSGLGISLLGTDAEHEYRDGYCVFIEPLPDGGEEMQLIEAGSLVTDAEADARAAHEILYSKLSNVRFKRVRGNGRQTAPLNMLLAKSGFAVFLLILGSLLVGFAVRPFRAIPVLVTLVLTAVLPPAIEQYAVRRANTVIRNPESTQQQLVCTAHLLSNTLFWKDQSESALREMINPESPRQVILRAKIALAESYARLVSETSLHASGIGSHFYLRDKETGMTTSMAVMLATDKVQTPRALVIDPDSNITFGRQLVTDSFLYIDGVAGICVAEWANLFTHKPVMIQIGDVDEMQQILADIPEPYRKFEPEEHPLWEEKVTPRLREMLAADTATD